MTGFWVFMLLMVLIVPVSMVGFGRLMLVNPPREINSLFGYRTAMSMKNQDTWEFAHKYCGRLWFRCGLVLLPLSVIPLLFVLDKDITTVSVAGLIVMFLQLIPMLGTISLTEAALRRTFDKDGVLR